MKRRITVVLILLIVLCLLSACGPMVQHEELPTVVAETVPMQTTIPQVEVPTETDVEPLEEILTPAERITEGVTVLLNTAEITAKMFDDNHYTKYEIHNHHILRMTSEAPFSSLYIEWDANPGAYSLEWEGGSLSCGENGFLHEYIRLPEPVTAVEFVFDGEDIRVICNLEVFTEGSAPEDIQIWLPPADGGADILVFPTHSDDDVLFFGALISYYAIERDLIVQTAFMVKHQTAWERGHERLDGLWEMGVRHYPILGTAPDSGRYEFEVGMNYYASSNIPGWQTEQIRRFKPFVVVGHDLNGEYGNNGHKVNAYYLTETIVDAADPEKHPESAQKYGVWDTPKLYLHLYPENEWYFDVNTPMENDPKGRTPFETAVDAFKHHASQNTGALGVQQNDDRPMYDCRRFGLYRSLVGTDSVADVMDHIDPEKWR